MSNPTMNSTDGQIRFEAETLTATTINSTKGQIQGAKIKTSFSKKRRPRRDVVLFARVRPDAKIPSKKAGDGCYDVYACFDKDYIEIKPGEIKLVPTGIASSLKNKYRFSVRERGSTGTKGMAVRAGQIDASYRGEWFIAIQNLNDKPLVIAKHPEYFDENDVIVYPYDRAIAQVALEIVPLIDVKVVPYEQLQKIPSHRGAGKLGSSGK